MGKLIRIDSFDVTFADSFARTALKVDETFIHTDGRKAKKGQGEKRIYVGADEATYDSFFQFDYDPKFFIQKSDLEDYFHDALEELANPMYKYGDESQTRIIFSEYREKLDALDKTRLFFKFRKTFDKQKRYYLVLQNGAENKNNYDYIRDIALPRVTRLLFVKFRDEATKAIYIYIKPVIWIKNKDSDEEKKEVYKVTLEPTPSQAAARRKNREGQEKYRQSILSRYPFCVVTKVTDPDLLIACHIKDHHKCEPHEKYDQWNGFSMTPTIHTLFDIGYLSFNEQGEMMLSDFFRNMDRKRLHLDGIIRIEINPKSLPYLRWHNENVFRKINIPEYV